MIIAIDFDGTLVEHKYPDIGNESPYAFQALRHLIEKGHRLILWTMRDGETLKEAVKFCEERGVFFWGVNSNPEQSSWSNSPKAFANLYIDDAAIGVPLRLAREAGVRPVVDWECVVKLLRGTDAL